MSDLIIYGTPLSPYTRAIRFALEYKDEPYSIYPYMPGSDEMKREHPMGKVPAIRDADVHLFETLACLYYIDDEYTEPRLQPRDSIDRAEMFQWMSYHLDVGMGVLGAGIVGPRIFSPLFGRAADEAKVQAALPQAEKVLAGLDKGLRGRRFVVGEELSLADVLMAPAFYLFKRTPEGAAMMPKFEHLSAWYTNMTTIQAFKDTEPELPR